MQVELNSETVTRLSNSRGLVASPVPPPSLGTTRLTGRMVPGFPQCTSAGIILKRKSAPSVDPYSLA